MIHQYFFGYGARTRAATQPTHRLLDAPLGYHPNLKVVECLRSKRIETTTLKESHLDTPAHAGDSMTLWVITPILGLPFLVDCRVVSYFTHTFKPSTALGNCVIIT